MRRFGAVLLALSMALGAGGTAVANPLDTFGYTAKGMALGGAMTAAAASYDATYYNPAGLGMLKGFELGLGAMTYKTFLTAKYSTLDTASGLLVRTTAKRNNVVRGAADIGIASPIPLGKGLERVLFLGASVSVPGPTLFAVRERPLQEPYFPMLEDRNRRLVLNVAAAGRWKWLMVGAGFSFIPSVTGRVNVDFMDGGNQNLTEVDVGTRLSPNVGLLVEPIPGLTVGVTWRGENRLDLSIPVSAVLSDKIAPVRLKVTAVDYSTPHQIALGAAYQTARFLVTGDVTYSLYHRFRASSPDVILYSSTSEGQVLKETGVPDPGFHDTWAVRVGGEFKPLKALALRAGFAWVQSPVPAQTGVMNLLDGDRYVGSVGLGFDAEGVGGPAITVDVAMAGGAMVGSEDAKKTLDAENPGYPSVGGEGWYLAGSLSAKVRF
jgi:long-chain fatty acid transport protein